MKELDKVMAEAPLVVTAELLLPPNVKLVGVSGRDVTVAFTEPVPASRRGTLLLDYEAALVKTVPGAVVWHEALGDRNSLRNLRGIEVKG